MLATAHGDGLVRIRDAERGVLLADRDDGRERLVDVGLVALDTAARVIRLDLHEGLLSREEPRPARVPDDLQLAANAGTASIGVSYGAHEHEAFEEFETRFVAHSTAELHRWLLAHA